MKTKILVFAMLGIAVASCGNKDREGAEALLQQTRQAIEAANYTEAIELLDTLNVRHASQIEARREGLQLRARAMEGIAVDSIEVVDLQLAQATVAYDSLRPLMKYIPAHAAGMDGYFLPQNAPANMMTVTGIRARVNEDGYLQLDVNVQNRRIGLCSIALSSGGSRWESQSVSDAALISEGGSESITLRQELIPDFGYWLSTHSGRIEIKFVGRSGSTTMTMTPALRSELLTAANYAHAAQARKSALIRREKFERMLVTARDQLANMATE